MKYIDRLLTLAVLAMSRFLVKWLPNRWFRDTKSRLAEVWFDLMEMPAMAGGATDTGFGKLRYFDDFLRRVYDATGTPLYVINNDGGGTSFAINLQHNGVIRGTGDGTDGDLTNIFSPNIWRSDRGGPMILEIRETLITSIADGENYIGWTDASGTDENPILVSTADAQTSAATNAVGFAYTGAGTADWKAVSVNAGADGTVTRCNRGGATTPVVGTWQTFRVTLNQDGDADFYIDGVQHYREDAAVSASTLLGIGVCQQDGGTGRSTDCDYFYLSAGRV